MSEPPLNHTIYDFIVVGTGLPESVLAAAATSAGKSVLQIDPQYPGSPFTSLSLTRLTSFLTLNSVNPPPPPSHVASALSVDSFPAANPVVPSSSSSAPPPSNAQGLISVDLVRRPLYSSVKTRCYDPEILKAHTSVDLCGPRVVFRDDESIKALLETNTDGSVYKNIGASLVGDSSGKLHDILTPLEEHVLNRFFELVQEHCLASSTEGDEIRVKISDEELETPFVDFLTKINTRFTPKLKSIILYVIAMLDYDQENKEKRYILRTKEGIARVARYLKSIGDINFRDPDAPGALMYPISGIRNLRDAFADQARDHGCQYVLGIPITSLLLDQESGLYKGVRLSSGQNLFSHKLVLNPSTTLTLESLPSSLTDQQKETYKAFIQKPTTKNEHKIARGICVVRGSAVTKQNISNALMVYPPKSLFLEQHTAIRVLQVGGTDLAVCPPDSYILYFSTCCDNDDQGERALLSAINNLTRLPDSAEEPKPILLWRATYVQEHIKGASGDTITSMPSPDGDLHYREILQSTAQLHARYMGIQELDVEDIYVGVSPLVIDEFLFRHGRDRKGCPVCYDKVFGQLNKKDLFDNQKMTAFWEKKINFMEKCKDAGGFSTFLQVVDLSNPLGLTSNELRAVATQATQAILMFKEKNPDFVFEVVFINVPWRVRARYKLNDPFVMPLNKSKLVLAGRSKSCETLFKYISPDQVPTTFGGLSDSLHLPSGVNSSTMVLKPKEEKTLEIICYEECEIELKIRSVGRPLIHRGNFLAEGGDMTVLFTAMEIGHDFLLIHRFKLTSSGMISLTIENPTNRKKTMLIYSFRINDIR